MTQGHSLLRLFLILKPLAYGVALASGFVLVITGFGPGFAGGQLHGLLLMAHMGCVLPFLLSVAFLSITCAKQHDLRDRVTLGSLCFWFLLLLAVPLTLTIIFSMFPLVGTDGQKALMKWHESIAIVFGVVGMLYILLRVGPKGEPEDA